MSRASRSQLGGGRRLWRPELRELARVGYAQAVRGFAIGSSSEVGADPGCQPGARVGAFRKERPIQRAKRQ